MSNNLQLPSGRHNTSQEVDASIVPTDHEWNLFPMHNMSFRHIIEECTDCRTDIERYKIITEADDKLAQKLFSEFCNTPTLFKIPKTLTCDRSFARDVEEIYYLSEMDRFLTGLSQLLNFEELPILKRPLFNRMFCAFSRKPGYYSELYERLRLNLWLPHDAPENKYFSDAELSAVHVKTEDWLNEIKQPPALPVPLPFVAYYYHKELRDNQRGTTAGDPERIRRLRYCLEHEYYVLFISCWWNEAFYGGKQFLLDSHTVDVLDNKCGSISNISGKPAQVIIEHMRNACLHPETDHNWMTFRDFCMDPSPFLWAVEKVGVFDHLERPGQQPWCSRLDRKITSSRYGGGIFKRISVMDRRLTGPDLDRVGGLVGLVHEQGWNTNHSLRVGDLISHLFNLNRTTYSRLGESLRIGDDRQRRLDDLQWRLDTTQRRLDKTQYRLDDTQYSLDDTKRRLNNSHDWAEYYRALNERSLRNEDNHGSNVTRNAVTNTYTEERQNNAQDTHQHVDTVYLHENTAQDCVGGGHGEVTAQAEQPDPPGSVDESQVASLPPTSSHGQRGETIAINTGENHVLATSEDKAGEAVQSGVLTRKFTTKEAVDDGSNEITELVSSAAAASNCSPLSKTPNNELCKSPARVKSPFQPTSSKHQIIRTLSSLQNPFGNTSSGTATEKLSSEALKLKKKLQLRSVPQPEFGNSHSSLQKYPSGNLPWLLQSKQSKKRAFLQNENSNGDDAPRENKKQKRTG